MIIKDGQRHGSALVQSTALPHCDPLSIPWRLGASFHILLSLSFTGRTLPCVLAGFFERISRHHAQKAKLSHLM